MSATLPSQTSGAPTKDRIVQAAYSEYSAQGYYKTSVDTITRRAGVSHGTFYRYFANKNEVLTHLMHRLLAPIPLSIEQLDAVRVLPVREERWPEFEAIIRQIIIQLADATGLLKAFMQALLQDRAMFAVLARIVRAAAAIFEVAIAAGQKKGQYPGCRSDIIAEIMATCVATSILMRSMGIIACSPEALARNIAGILYPALMLDRRRRRTRKTAAETAQTARRGLIKAAKEEFAAHGYFDAKIADIVHKAGCSRASFYLYFRDKDDLIEAIFQDMLATLNPLPLSAASSSLIDRLDPDSIEQLIDINAVIVDLFDAPFNWALLQGTFYSEQLSAHYKEIYLLYSAPLMRKFRMLQDLGRCQGIDPFIAAHIILATVSFAAFLRTVGVIDCGKPEFAINMAWMLHYFLQYTPRGLSASVRRRSKP